MHTIDRVYKKWGADPRRLFHWLQLPKQGISAQVAMHVIQDVAQELKEGKRWWEECLMYPEPYRKKLAEKAFPAHFWIDNYVLERCRMMQDDMLIGGQSDQMDDLLQLQIALNQLYSGIAEIDSMVRPIKNFLTVPNYLKPKVWWEWLKWAFTYG